MRFFPSWSRSLTGAVLIIIAADAAGAGLGIATSTAGRTPLVLDAVSAGNVRRELRLRRDGDQVELRDDRDGAVLARRGFAATSNVVVNGSSGDDTLTVDFRGGNPVPAGGLLFDGGGQTTREGDALAVVGGAFHTATYDYLNNHDGSIDLDGVKIRYRGLEPLANSGTAANVIFNLPNVATNAVLEDDGTAGNGISQLRSTNGTFETTTFANPTGSLTINGGTAGDAIAVASDFDSGAGAGQFNASLTIDGAGASDTIALQAPLSLAGTASFTAEGITLSSNVTTSGNQDFTGPVTLGAAALLTSTSSGDVTFSSTLNGAFALTVNTAGGTNFFGVVGGVTPLASVLADPPGLTRVAANVTTSGSQAWGDQLALFASPVLTSSGSGAISFANVDNNFNLTVNTAGPTTFNNPVGGLVALASLTTDAPGTTAINGGAVTTNNNQTYNDPVTLGAAALLTSTSGGDVTFNVMLNGAFALTVNTAGGTNFFGVVGGVTPLASLQTDAPGLTRVAANVTTSGSQTWGDQLALFSSAVLTSNGSGAISFANVDNNFNLTVNTAGPTTFNNPVGGLVALASLTTDAPGTTAINGGAVTTNGAQSFGDAVTLGAGTTLTSNAAGNVGLAQTVNGAFALVVNTGGTTTFGGAVGGTTPLVSVTTDAPGATAINGGGATTSGAQAYNDPVTLGAAAVFTSTSSGDITFNVTLNGAFALTVNTAGGTNFFGVVGGVTPLASLQTDAPGLTRVAANVTTSGSQTWGDQLALFSSVVLTSNGSGAISFANVDNNFNLTVNTAGPTTFNNPVGGLVALASLTTDAPGTTAINGGAVTTNGAQSFGDPVTLGAGTTLTSNAAGNVGLAQTVNGAFALAVNTAGTTTFGGGVGGTTPLVSVTTDAPGATAINGGGVTTSAGQTYNDPVSLGAATVLSIGGAGTIPSVVSGGFSLTKAGPGTLALAGANTYAGGTVVSAGTLLVNNVAGSGAGTGAVSVAAGAILGGNGTISGSVTLQAGGVVAPGNGGIGTLTTGAVLWNGAAAGATARFDLSNVNTTSDRLAAGGALTKGSGPAFTFDFLGTGQAAVYTLATFTSTTFSAADFTFVNLAPGLDGVFSIAGGNTLLLTAGSAAATTFQVTAPATAVAGVPFPFTVTALNQFAHVATGYAGTVNFSSTDAAALLPGGSTLTSGVGTFNATLVTIGSRTITAVDAGTPSITGTSGPIVVGAPVSLPIPTLSPIAALLLISLLASFAVKRLRG